MARLHGRQPSVRVAAGATPAPVENSVPYALQPIEFKTIPPELIEYGSGYEVALIWQIEEDVIKDTVTVKVQDGDTTTLPDGHVIVTSAHMKSDS